MRGSKCDWNVWRAFDSAGKTLALRVVRRGESAQDAFKALAQSKKKFDIERSATVHNCNKEQAIDVMNALNPDVFCGRPN